MPSINLSYNGQPHPRIGLKDMVAQQLPEFVRAQYPTFVAFLEAYYEWMDQNEVDLTTIRDIDTTLNDFIKYFKAELAHNYPIVSTNYETERFLLKHIKEQYLAKGSESSYKLLFRLLFGKDVFIDYPGRQMLRISDGRWTQDVSLFVRVFQGNPEDIIGKVVTIQTSQKIYNLAVVSGVDAADTVTATVENVVAVEGEPGVYELFVNRNFYGKISPNDSIKFGSEFQGVILPATTRIRISAEGEGFRPGQVFQIASGEGTAFWFKVAEIYDNGGLKKIDVIKFGLNYNTDFSVTVLPTSAVSTKKKLDKGAVSVSYSVISGTIAGFVFASGGANYTLPPLITVQGDGSGAELESVIDTDPGSPTYGELIDINIINAGSGYTTAFLQFTNAPGDTTGIGASADVVLGDDYDYNYADAINGFTEGGYVNWGDYWELGPSQERTYSDGAYVGTVARQFFINAADTLGDNPARLEVNLGAVAKYPGYYKTNDGFLNDSMFIQDSYYYQAFAYVLKIDEQLQSYASVVRSMLHPSGMAMFGEYSINNKINLAVALTSLVKSLGITLYDTVAIDDNNRTFWFTKDLSDNSYPIELLERIVFSKYLEDSFTPTHGASDLQKILGKIFGTGSDVANQQVTLSEIVYQTFTKLADEETPHVGYSATYPNGEIVYETFGKNVPDSDAVVVATDQHDETIDGVLYPNYPHPRLDINLNTLINDPNFLDDVNAAAFGSTGYIVLDPYEEGGYFAEIYANGRASTW